MNKSEFFSGMADVIDEFGWIQKRYGNPDIGFCMIGAARICSLGIEKIRDKPWLRYHATLTPAQGQWLDEMNNWLHPDPPTTIFENHSIAAWNDAWNRTKEEVVVTLRKYAEEVAHEQV